MLVRFGNDFLLVSANCHPYGHIESVALPVEREGLPVPYSHDRIFSWANGGTGRRARLKI